MLLATPLFAAADTYRAGPVSISLEFQWIRQGHVGIVRVSGVEIVEVRAVFQDRLYRFYPDPLGYVGLVSADMDKDIGIYVMQVWITYADGSAERIDQEVEVNYGEFGRSEVTVSASLLPLMEDDVELSEADKLGNITSRFTPERYWTDQGFIMPTDTEIIGWFGAWRLYNETYWRRHSGTDFKMGSGTPVIAAASGRVMLVELLSIRGNYVLIDHGWSVFSGYAHMSQTFVVPGQFVRQGDVIGMSGNTGRSSGAHLHLEISVGGVWVNPEDFIALGVDKKE